MVTRGKIGVRMPNPKYAFHATINSNNVEPSCFGKATTKKSG